MQPIQLVMWVWMALSTYLNSQLQENITTQKSQQSTTTSILFFSFVLA